MNHDDRLQYAIRCARTGDRIRARDLLIELLEEDATQVIAWVWLIDLLDDLEDRIYACEQVLAADPHNPQLQTKYQKLLAQRVAPVPYVPPQPAPRPTPQTPPRPAPLALPTTSFDPDPPAFADPLDAAEHLLTTDQRPAAQKILIPYLKANKRNERAWYLMSEAVEDESKQISALTNVLRLNPHHEKARQRLKDLQHFRENPLDLAALYEEEGKFDEAINVLHRATLTINYGPEFDKIYANIARLEKRKVSGVVHIQPNYSITRLTFGPPLLFFLLMLVHNRMNLFALTPLLWLGVLFTLGGGFLLALANVRSHHPLWSKLFDDPGASRSPLARLTVSLAGWLLLFVSFAYLFQISIERLPLVATNTFIQP